MHLGRESGYGGSRTGAFALALQRLSGQLGYLLLHPLLLRREPLYFVSKVRHITTRLGQISLESSDSLAVHLHLLSHTALVSAHLVHCARVDLDVPQQALAPAFVHV